MVTEDIFNFFIWADSLWFVIFLISLEINIFNIYFRNYVCSSQSTIVKS